MAPRAAARSVVRAAPTSEWTLSSLEYDVVCAELGIEQMPYPMPITRHGVTLGERATLTTQARAALAGRGLWPAGGLDDGLVTALQTVAGAPVTVDVLGYDGVAVRAVAGRLGRWSAVVAAAGTGVMVRMVGDVSPIAALLALFPNHPPGPGQSLSVPLRAFLEISGQYETDEGFDPFDDPGRRDDTAVLRRHGVSPMDAVQVCGIANERFRGGQFGFTSCPPGARPDRGDVVFSFYDTPSGRYLMVNDGTWVSIVPADAARIAGRIESAVAEELARLG